jgi:CRISPR-associated endonuclease Csn1
VRTETGIWVGEVITTFDAYQLVRMHGVARLRHPTLSASGKPLVMRLMIDDVVRFEMAEKTRTMRIVTISANGQIYMANVFEANVDARNRNRDDSFTYVSKTARKLQSAACRKVSISPIGDLHDPRFKDETR